MSQSSQHAFSPTQSKHLLILLICLTSLSPMSMDIYLPSLTIIMDYFSVSYNAVQLSLGLFLIGVSFFQLVLGPLSDAYGRRPILFGGLFIYILATLVCALSPSIAVLNIARLVQGMGGCAAAVTSMAVARDHFDAKQSAKVIATITSAIGLVPVLAPSLGTFLQETWGWRSNFIFLLIVSIVLLIASFFTLQESRARHYSFSFAKMKADYRHLLSTRSFRIYNICGIAGFGALVAFVANSPYYFITLGKVSVTYFSVLFGVNACFFILGSFLTSRLTSRIRLEVLTAIGGILLFIGGAIQAFLLLFLPYSIFSIVIPMLIATFGISIIMPVTMAGSLAPFRPIAGSASALAGFSRFLGSSLIGVLAGLLISYSVLALSGILTLLGILIFSLMFSLFDSESVAVAV